MGLTSEYARSAVGRTAQSAATYALSEPGRVLLSPADLYSFDILAYGLLMRTTWEPKSTVTAAASFAVTRPIP